MMKQFSFVFRPLPADYLHYAREDTHYLLYIHDLLRNRLLQIRQNNPELLQEVFQRSKSVCEKVKLFLQHRYRSNSIDNLEL